jgi:hypothetical protein|tara:strand:+ start:896 stop:1330 length:435 start_codon:yes stop_codon:yes gene_type:complete
MTTTVAHWPPPLVLHDDLDPADAPPHMRCALSGVIMTAPAIVASTGLTYQRDAVEKFVAERGCDPSDARCAVDALELAPNLAVRQLVEAHARARSKDGSLPPQSNDASTSRGGGSGGGGSRAWTWSTLRRVLLYTGPHTTASAW